MDNIFIYDPNTKDYITLTDLDDCTISDLKPTPKQILDLGRFDGSMTITSNHQMGASLEKLTTPSPYETVDISFQIPVQKRRHKQKRINKKWQKRYGYKMSVVETHGWRIHSGIDGEVEFQTQDYSGGMKCL